MLDVFFNSLMIHYCTIQQEAVQVTSGSTYGHASIARPYEVPGIEYLEIICRAVPGSQSEQFGAWHATDINVDYTIFISSFVVPDLLKNFGSQVNHRITNIRHRINGAIIDPGPFDIKQITNAAGVDHHFELSIKRVGSDASS